MKKITIILYFILTLITTHAFSQQQGCMRGSYIYYVLDAEGDYRDGYIQFEYNYYYERLNIADNCFVDIGGYSSCFVDDNVGSASGLGTLVSFGPVHCPIDTNTWALLTFSIIPIVVFRKKYFNNNNAKVFSPNN